MCPRLYLLSFNDIPYLLTYYYVFFNREIWGLSFKHHETAHVFARYLTPGYTSGLIKSYFVTVRDVSTIHRPMKGTYCAFSFVQDCSLFYTKRFCMQCVNKHLDQFPHQIRAELAKKKQSSKPGVSWHTRSSNTLTRLQQNLYFLWNKTFGTRHTGGDCVKTVSSHRKM